MSPEPTPESVYYSPVSDGMEDILAAIEALIALIALIIDDEIRWYGAERLLKYIGEKENTNV